MYHCFYASAGQRAPSRELHIVYSSRYTDKMQWPHRPERQSDHMKVREVSNILHAARLAEAQGTPVNVMLTVNITMMGRNSPCVAPVARALAERYRKWVTRPGKRSPGPKARPAYYWAAENPSHTHVHLSMHVPQCRMDDFKRAALKWVTAVLGRIFHSDAVHFQDLDYAPGNAEYLCKGTNKAIASAMNLKQAPQGWIIGTRSQTSRTLGPGSKKRLRDEGAYPQAQKRRVR
jgi:hypothetical protein